MPHLPESLPSLLCFVPQLWAQHAVSGFSVFYLCPVPASVSPVPKALSLVSTCSVHTSLAEELSLCVTSSPSSVSFDALNFKGEQVF